MAEDSGPSAGPSQPVGGPRPKLAINNSSAIRIHRAGADGEHSVLSRHAPRIELEKQTVLLPGGAGDVGVGVMQAALSQNARVVILSRSQRKLDRVRAAAGDMADRLVTIRADLSTEKGAERAVAEFESRQLGPLAGVVATLGGWRKSGPLLETERREWDQILGTNLTTHLTAARVFAPFVRDGGAYVVVNGGAATSPVRNAAPMSVAAAALDMLGRALAEEFEDIGVRLHRLRIDTPVATRARSDPKPEWPTAEEVGQVALWLLSEQAALMQGGLTVVRGRS